MSRRISELGADVGNALGNNDGGDDVGDDDVDALLAMHLATSAVAMLAMHSNLCCAELFGDVGDWRFDSIRFDSIRLDWMESVACESISFQVRTFLFPLTTGGVAVVAVEKRKKSPAAAVGFRPANLTARQFLQYIR